MGVDGALWPFMSVASSHLPKDIRPHSAPEWGYQGRGSGLRPGVPGLQHLYYLSSTKKSQPPFSTSSCRSPLPSHRTRLQQSEAPSQLRRLRQLLRTIINDGCFSQSGHLDTPDCDSCSRTSDTLLPNERRPKTMEFPDQTGTAATGDGHLKSATTKGRGCAWPLT